MIIVEGVLCIPEEVDIDIPVDDRGTVETVMEIGRDRLAQVLFHLILKIILGDNQTS
jgi:hypothetical protein